MYTKNKSVLLYTQGVKKAETLSRLSSKLPEATVGRLRGFVELGAWQRNKLRQTPELLFFPWAGVSDVPVVPPKPTKRHRTEGRQRPDPKDTARRYQSLLDAGTVKTRAELARFLGVSRARVTQVLRRLDQGEDSEVKSA